MEFFVGIAEEPCQQYYKFLAGCLQQLICCKGAAEFGVFANQNKEAVELDWSPLATFRLFSSKVGFLNTPLATFHLFLQTAHTFSNKPLLPTYP